MNPGFRVYKADKADPGGDLAAVLAEARKVDQSQHWVER